MRSTILFLALVPSVCFAKYPDIRDVYEEGISTSSPYCEFIAEDLEVIKGELKNELKGQSSLTTVFFAAGQIVQELVYYESSAESRAKLNPSKERKQLARMLDSHSLDRNNISLGYKAIRTFENEQFDRWSKDEHRFIVDMRKALDNVGKNKKMGEVKEPRSWDESLSSYKRLQAKATVMRFVSSVTKYTKKVCPSNVSQEQEETGSTEEAPVYNEEY